MGKKLIIRGADFSENGISSVMIKSGLKTTADNQFIEILGVGGVEHIYPTSYKLKASFSIDRSKTTQGDLEYGFGSNKTQIIPYVNSSGTANVVAFSWGSIEAINKGQGLVTDFVVEMENGKVTVNGNEYAVTTGESSENHFGVFGKLNTSGTLEHGSKEGYLTFKDLKIYDGGNELIGHYRPCVDANGVACIYESVNDKYYYANSGSLIAI